MRFSAPLQHVHVLIETRQVIDFNECICRNLEVSSTESGIWMRMVDVSGSKDCKSTWS